MGNKRMMVLAVLLACSAACMGCFGGGKGQDGPTASRNDGGRNADGESFSRISAEQTSGAYGGGLQGEYDRLREEERRQAQLVARLEGSRYPERNRLPDEELALQEIRGRLQELDSVLRQNETAYASAGPASAGRYTSPYAAGGMNDEASSFPGRTPYDSYDNGYPGQGYYDAGAGNGYASNGYGAPSGGAAYGNVSGNGGYGMNGNYSGSVSAYGSEMNGGMTQGGMMTQSPYAAGSGFGGAQPSPYDAGNYGPDSYGAGMPDRRPVPGGGFSEEEERVIYDPRVEAARPAPDANALVAMGALPPEVLGMLKQQSDAPMANPYAKPFAGAPVGRPSYPVPVPKKREASEPEQRENISTERDEESPVMRDRMAPNIYASRNRVEDTLWPVGTAMVAPAGTEVGKAPLKTTSVTLPDYNRDRQSQSSSAGYQGRDTRSVAPIQQQSSGNDGIFTPDLYLGR